ALYGTIWILLIAYLCRFLPHGVRASSISMLRIGPELVESAATSGASWSLTMRRVVLPLLRPGLLAGWLYVAIVALRELSSSIVLYSPGTEVVAVVVWDFWQNGQMAETAACGVMLMAALAGLLVAARSLGLRVAGPI
ncbi:MAG: ABC transporter permease subunit, partial [Alphaproteobacteria bacterium]|nr:ABC transporter permease subunit [Alphaproteobacteria bacterium]